MATPPYPTKIDRKLVGLKAHAFVADADTYFGKAMCNLLLAQNYTITTTLRDPTGPTPSYVHQVVSTDTESLRPALLACDLIVYHLTDTTEPATRAIRYLMGSHYEVEKTFVLVSSILTWAATTPVGELAPDAAVDADGDPQPDEVSESMYQRRQPHHAYASWKEVEKLCRRANSETFHTYVLFSGLQYGDGEGALLNLFRTAWQTLPSGVPLIGDGSNVVPTIHVKDLVRYIFALSQRTGGPEDYPRYTFAIDHGRETWGTVIQRVADVLGNGVVTPLDPTETSLYSNPALFLMNLVVAEESRDIDATLRDQWHAPSGLLTHADLAALEFRHAHNILPLRVCVLGPPASGKSYYAAQLAEKYNVRHLTTPGVIAEFVKQEEELSNQLAARKEAVAAKKRAVQESTRAAAAAAADSVGDGSGDDEDASADGGASEDDEFEMGSDDGAVIDALQQRVADIRRVLAMKIHVPPPNGDDRRGRRRPHGSAGKQRTRLNAAQLQAQQVADSVAAEARAHNGRYTSRCLALMWRWMLHQPDVRNKGYVMDGFPRTVTEARLVFERMTAEELAPPDDAEPGAMVADDDVSNMAQRPADDALFPESVIVLQAEESFLAERAAELTAPPEGPSHNTPAGFERRLAKWRERALTSRGLLVYLDSQAAVPGSADPDAPPPPTHPADPVQRELVQRAFAVDTVPPTAAGSSSDAPSPLLNEMVSFLGPPRHFGATLEVIAAQKDAASASEIEKRNRDAEEREKEAAADASVHAALNERRAVDAAVLDVISSHEEAELALRKAPLKDYLMEYVVPTLAKGLVEVCERRPEDPVDYLGP